MTQGWSVWLERQTFSKVRLYLREMEPFSGHQVSKSTMRQHLHANKLFERHATRKLFILFNCNVGLPIFNWFYSVVSYDSKNSPEQQSSFISKWKMTDEPIDIWTWNDWHLTLESVLNSPTLTDISGSPIPSLCFTFVIFDLCSCLNLILLLENCSAFSFCHGKWKMFWIGQCEIKCMFHLK